MRASTATIGLMLAAGCLFLGPAHAQDAMAGKQGSTDEARGPPTDRIVPKRGHGETVTPKRPRTTPTAETKPPYSQQPKHLTSAPVSCIEACRAACAGPKKGASACGPAYQSCVAAC